MLIENTGKAMRNLFRHFQIEYSGVNRERHYRYSNQSRERKFSPLCQNDL